jgi:circadian clock protein KaiC
MGKEVGGARRDTNVERPKTKLPKTRTGINGLDEILNGGLPKGRPTLVCGGPGCGKTLLGLQFLYNGAVTHKEPGVLVLFEESSKEVIENSASLGYDLAELERKGLLVIDPISIEPGEIIETGEYNLDGLFIRLGNAIDSIGACRVVLDTIESLFTGIPNEVVVRAELRRLFRWLKEKDVTTIVTGESGERTLTRQGLEEYISDCVIVLDHRILGQISTRRIRVAKYRGSDHGTNEYPFIIGEDGISVLPITSVGLNYTVSKERISTGIDDLDQMLEGKGYYRGSTILVSGDSGTGKTTIAMSFTKAACERGEKALFIATEESPDQLIRNMRSIGIDLEPFVKKGLLRFHSMRATTQGLETHLAMMHRMIDSFGPDVLVVDPITTFTAIGSSAETKSMIARVIDYCKTKKITTVLTDLLKRSAGGQSPEASVSSLMDTWISLERIESNGEHNRGLYVLKSRGMNHSNQIREFQINDRGVKLRHPYIGTGGVLTGTARYIQEARDLAKMTQNESDLQCLELELETLRMNTRTHVKDVQSEFRTKEKDLIGKITLIKTRTKELKNDEEEMRMARGPSSNRPKSQRKTVTK